MHEDYYQNILYPLQDKVLSITGTTGNQFYLTGGTALSRAYLNHRYSDDLDFFVNGDDTYKDQVERIHRAMLHAGLKIETGSVTENHVRWFIREQECVLKVDFVNDIAYRVGIAKETALFKRTDTIRNILSNKLTALGRLEAKDVVDIVFICRSELFNWKEIFNEAVQKDMWVNPVDTVALLETFPVQNIDKISWIGPKPKADEFRVWINTIIPDILKGNDNSLFSR